MRNGSPFHTRVKMDQAAFLSARLTEAQKPVSRTASSSRSTLSQPSSLGTPKALTACEQLYHTVGLYGMIVVINLMTCFRCQMSADQPTCPLRSDDTVKRAPRSVSDQVTRLFTILPLSLSSLWTQLT